MEASECSLKKIRDMKIFAAPIATAQRLTSFWISELGGKEVRHKVKACVYNNVHQVYASFAAKPSADILPGTKESNQKETGKGDTVLLGKKGRLFHIITPFE